jgi:hypothetical protein
MFSESGVIMHQYRKFSSIVLLLMFLLMSQWVSLTKAQTGYARCNHFPQTYTGLSGLVVPYLYLLEGEVLTFSLSSTISPVIVEFPIGTVITTTTTGWFGTFTIPADGPYSFSFSMPSFGSFILTVTCDPIIVSDPEDPATDLPVDLQPAFTDGRLNNWDMGNPVVVYGYDDETRRGLHIYSTAGILLLEVSSEQIAAVAECPSENTLIASAGAVELYRLTNCKYQLNAPSLDGTKIYTMIFNALYVNTGYTSYEE